jgi:hypothetical protein
LTDRSYARTAASTPRRLALPSGRSVFWLFSPPSIDHVIVHCRFPYYIQGNRQASPAHHLERSIGQRQHAPGVQILDEYAVQEFMNEINTLLRRAHQSPGRLILFSRA